VTATMTWVGLDIHARSTHAAAIDRESGELSRARFGAGVGPVVEWLRELPQPLHACYEAGPTGYALYRAAEAAGLRIDVVAPSKTPRAPADRVKTDRKDAELLVRLLLAGSLSVVAVPSASFEAARDLARAREQVRADLARLRHRVSKLLLRYGRVYDGGGTWTQAHRRWLAAQRFDHVPTELAYLDALAAIDGLLARRAALDERLSLLATEPEHWRSRGCAASEGSRRSRRSSCSSRSATSGASNGPASSQPGSDSSPRCTSRARARRAARSPRPAPATPVAFSSRQPGTTCASRASARLSVTGTPASPTTSSRSPGAHSTASTDCSDGCAHAANPATSPLSPPHANSPASSGRQPSPTDPNRSRPR
jgi:Transposase